MSSSDKLSFMIALDDGLRVLRAGSVVNDDVIRGLSARLLRAMESGILDPGRLSRIARRHAREMLTGRLTTSPVIATQGRIDDALHQA